MVRSRHPGTVRRAPHTWTRLQSTIPGDASLEAMGRAGSLWVMGARPATASVAPPATLFSEPPTTPAGRRRATTTSAFGVGRREGHDASDFYARFAPPHLSENDDVAPPAALDTVWVGDARDMDAHGSVADGSVALVVTSPPYFAGKEYEQ